MIAASYGFLSASFSRDEEIRSSMTRFSAKWALVSLVLAIPFGYWYVAVLPAEAQQLVLGKSPTIGLILPWGLAGVVLFFVVALIVGILRPSFNFKPVALLSMVSALLIIGGFEWIREAARRPYVLNDVMYSNGILRSQEDLLNSSGFMKNAIWTENLVVDEANLQEVGHELFINQCFACHTMGGGNNDIVPITANMSFRALQSYLAKIHEIRYFMPPFFGTDDERVALAAFIAGGIHDKPVELAPVAAVQEHAGKLLFEDHCSSCHAVEDITGAFADLPNEEIVEMLRSLDTISDEMEPFEGTEEEPGFLADYLSDPEKANVPATPAVLSGEQLFEDNCSACHDAQSIQDSLDGSDAGEVVEALATLDEISEEMQPFSGSEDEALRLAQFLAGEQDSAAAVPDLEQGIDVFRKHCGMCHGPQQMSPKLAGKERAEIFDILGRLDELQRTMPPFRGTVAEKEILADYLFSISQGGN